MPDNVLVDTSVWIDYFQAPRSHVVEPVTRLLEERRAVTTGIVALELIQGAKSDKELSVVEDLLKAIARIDERETTHVEAGRLGYRLRRKGLTFGTVDLLISQLAIEHGLSLYTQDRHVQAIAKASPLKLYGIE